MSTFVADFEADRRVSDVSGKATSRFGSKAGLPLDPLGQPADIDDSLAAVRRILVALSRSVGASDIEALRSLVELRAEVEESVIGAIAGLRNDPVTPASWAEIGDALGVSHQAAQQRYGHVGGARRRGGQPGHLR